MTDQRPEASSADNDLFRVMMLGDIVARCGRLAVKQLAKQLRQSRNLDLIIANGENASGGVGITPETASELEQQDIDVVTLGDHTWHNRAIRAYLEQNSGFCIRPGNYPEGAPGRGWTVWTSPSGLTVGVMNLMGRIFNNIPLECPFRKADEILAGPLKDCQLIVLDFHAEATSEKIAMGRHLDGRVSLVVGTHTHVQTADEQILPEGTGFLTDLGMCGSTEGVIGMASETALARFIKGLPESYKAAEGRSMVQGVIAEISRSSRRVVRIERVREVFEG
jgi:metallophosphoesterase (TIGR00282 family)